MAGEATQNDAKMPTQGLTWWKVALAFLGACASLYIFLCGLDLMGGSFKVLGGRGASSLFTAVDNPLAGLMTGILATVLVQSSSTSTSIVVALVGEGGLSVKNGIPIIMGANIGTSVTNTIVSMGQSGDRIMLERAFAGATVHDMFNMLTVLVLLPTEVIIGAIQGEGGPLYWITKAITEGLMGGDKGSELFVSPITVITGDLVEGILKANKYVIYALSLAEPVEGTPSKVNETLCKPLANSTRRLEEAAAGEDDGDSDFSRSLLSRRSDDRRLAEKLQDCSTYYCLSKDLDSQFKKISLSSYEKLHKCTGYILDAKGKPCGSQVCYIDSGSFYETKVKESPLIKGGFLVDAGDMGGGILGLVISLIFLVLGLIGLSKLLQIIFMGNAKKVIRYAVKLNGYVAIAIGCGITIIVQSSSVTTSALTPLCGIGVLPLAKMLPLTLGANIGTTCTALIASLVSLKFGAVQIALCHLFFNIIGIAIWYPIPFMRRVPLAAAKLLGLYASFYRFVPALYILVAFVLLPALFLGLSAVWDASVGGGVVLLIFILVVFVVFELLWLVGWPVGSPLCYKVLSKDSREEGRKALEKADREVQGLPEPEESPSAAEPAATQEPSEAQEVQV